MQLYLCAHTQRSHARAPPSTHPPARRGSSHPDTRGARAMAFGLINTRRYVLVYLFFATAFMNAASIYPTMWSVATMSVFMLMLTDFMFFEDNEFW